MTQFVCTMDDYIDILTRDTYARIMFKEGKKPEYSTGICGSTTAGYGKLDQNGYWEFSLPVNQETLEIEL